jgi:uncharacterized protein YlxW (UPF0749 family)
MKFFWSKAKGLNADIERHRAKEQELQAKIDELEHKTDEMSVAALRTYRHFMYQLQVSKADVVNKIGKK